MSKLRQFFDDLCDFYAGIDWIPALIFGTFLILCLSYIALSLQLDRIEDALGVLADAS